MPFSVALNQPRFEEDDFGGLGQWEALVGTAISSLISVGGQFALSKINASNIADQIRMQTEAARDLAAFNAQKAMEVAKVQAQQAIEVEHVAAATPITSNPLFLPVIGVAAVVLFLSMRK